MEKHSKDITYAYAQLGLKEGASLTEIRATLANASAYKFFTKARVDHVRRFVDFFNARHELGGFDVPHADLRSAYRRKAMDLHPDRNAGDKDNEERLKILTASYAIVEKINQQAKRYYAQSDITRHEGEARARETTIREKAGFEETPRSNKTKNYRAAFTEKETQAKSGAKTSAKKYMAASVPRSVRNARISYMPTDVVFASRWVKQKDGSHYIFDYFMLPEAQFLRARAYISAPETTNPALQYGKFNPPYTLRDVKTVTVPKDVTDGETWARGYFKKLFGI